jgi:hypothetical protein
LPWWKDEDACHIVVVPGHFLLAEEANDLAVRVLGFLFRSGGQLNEGVVEESAGVEEDGFGLQEQFGEE